MPRNNRILYYDCTNFFFEIECEDDFRKYGNLKKIDLTISLKWFYLWMVMVFLYLAK